VSWGARVVLLVVLCTSPGHGKAAEQQGFLDGSKLFDLCKEDGSITNQHVCVGYLMGVADVGQQLHNGTLCMPTGVGVSDLRALVMEYLHDNPQQWRFAAYSTVLTVFLDAFPCSKEEESSTQPQRPTKGN